MGSCPQVDRGMQQVAHLPRPQCDSHGVSRRSSLSAYRVGTDIEAFGEEARVFAHPDYASAFEVLAPGSDRTAEQWVRAMFEAAPAAVRWLLVFGWKYVLRFRLGPRASPDHVLGWKIVANAPDSIVLELRSPLLSAQKILRTEHSRTFTMTLVRYERRFASVLWLAATPVHHRTEPYLLGRAAPRAAAHSLRDPARK
jgi:Protein of unknown function (DUF2867)